MNTTRVCQTCGAPLPPDAPQGLCPQCLLKTDPIPKSDPSSGGASARRFPKPPELSEIAAHFPQYEILECIGQGGMGVVYKARQPRLDRWIALKVLPVELASESSFTERFTREARALAKLNHPGIVAIYDFGNVGPFYYLVMEYVDGASVQKLIQSRQIQPAEALGLVAQICDALQFAHDLGVVHRDIKPSNILVDRFGRIKIADFGLAKLLEPAAADIALTGEHHVMGTPHYMAPEQRTAPLAVDHRADIYSLGVVFYEMLTGELPMGRFAPPSQRVQVDVRLDDVVLRTLEQEPARRYQRAGDVGTSVQNIAASAPPAEKTPRAPGSPIPPTQPIASKRYRILARSWPVAVLSIVAAWAAWAYWPDGTRVLFREVPPSFGHVTSEARFCDYALEAPRNHRVSFWIEWQRNGQTVKMPGFELSDSITPARGQAYKGYVDLVIENAMGATEGETNTIRWKWGLRGGNVLSGGGYSALDPWHGLRVTDSSYGHQPVRRFKPGREITLVVVRGDRDQLEGHPWDELMAGRADLEMRLKVRVDPVPENELGELPKTGLQVPPASVPAEADRPLGTRFSPALESGRTLDSNPTP